MSTCKTLAATVPPPETIWIIPDLIPLGELVLLDGATGVGKSCFLAHLAALESKRPQQPDSKGVLYITSTYQKDIRDHHLTRHEANLGNIHEIPFDLLGYIAAFGKENKEYPLLKNFLEFIEHTVEEQKPALIIIDSLEEILAYCTDAREDVWRCFWQTLMQLTAQHCCTIVVPRLHGMNERRHYGAGARTGTELARHILTMHWHPYHADKRVVTIAKNIKGPMGFQFHIHINPLGRMTTTYVDVQDHVRPAKSPQTWMADPAHLDQTSEIFDQVVAKMKAKPIRKQVLEEHIVSLGFSKRAYHRTMSRAKLESVRKGADWYYEPTLSMMCHEMREQAEVESNPRDTGAAGDDAVGVHDSSCSEMSVQNSRASGAAGDGELMELRQAV